MKHSLKWILLIATMCLQSCTTMTAECVYAEIMTPNPEIRPYISEQFAKQLLRHNRNTKKICKIQ